MLRSIKYWVSLRFKIDLDVMVVPGVEETYIKHAIGWMTSTGFPGEQGNVVLAGHRSHSYGEFFHRLDETNGSFSTHSNYM